MKRNAKSYCTLVAGCWFCVAMAQPRHEFSLYGGGALSALKYTLAGGERKNSFGGQAGFEYVYFFSPNTGLVTGTGVSFFNTQATVGRLSDSYAATDIEGHSFEFRSLIAEHEEAQHAAFLRIPLMLHYRATGKRRWYLSVGGNVGIPLSAGYRSKPAELVNSGYYQEENCIYDTQRFMGFGAFSGSGRRSDIGLKPAFFASVEAGMKWRIKKNMFLYTGLYLDYGLNNILKQQQTDRLATYNAAQPENFPVYSVLTSQYTQDNHTGAFTNRLIPVAAGLQVKLSFGHGLVRKQEPARPSFAGYPELSEQDKERMKTEQEKTERIWLQEQHRAEENMMRKASEETYKRETPKNEPAVLRYAMYETAIAPEYQPVLDEKIALLKKYIHLHVICEGHADEGGTNAGNYQTGLRRAETVKDYLIAHGIAADRIITRSKGKSELLAPTDDTENRYKNRRVIVDTALRHP